MSKIWLPPSVNRTPVQMTNICVLVHHETKRILCFCLDDPFADSFAERGYDKIEIKHAHEYDKWANAMRKQATEQSEEEDYVYLEKENVVRQRLRSQLRARIAEEPNASGKKAVEAALHCLDSMEKRRQRKRETFMFQEAYDSSKDAESVTETLLHG